MSLKLFSSFIYLIYIVKDINYVAWNISFSWSHLVPVPSYQVWGKSNREKIQFFSLNPHKSVVIKSSLVEMLR